MRPAPDHSIARRRRTALSLCLIVAVGSACTGERPPPGPPAEAEAIPNRHSQPIIVEDGRTLLWAAEDDEGATEWFDMTDSPVDPHRFQFGIGKDEIPSIDRPEFIAMTDPRLAERGVTRETEVLGVEIDGIARAYPVTLMSLHEVVNDRFGDKDYAVLW